VLVNGFTTAKFKIEQSVKQGDALSCALFVLAIEPLLTKIQKNEQIVPITIEANHQNGVTKVEIKKAGFADDITCLTKNESSLQIIIDEYENFSSKSGVKLNVDKTEVLVIGKNSGNVRNFIFQHGNKTVNISEQKKVKICGMTFANDLSVTYKDNVINRIEKLERQLNIWRQRNLTLEGKILITKTFGLSQIIYAMQSTSVKEEDLKRIDDIIYRFIWNLKSDSYRVAGKIRRQMLTSTVENGGLNAPDVFAIDKAIKYKALINSFTTTHPVKTIYQKILDKMGFNFSNFSCLHKRDSFLGKATKAHCDSLLRINHDIITLNGQRDGIHKNYYAVIQNSDLRLNQFTNPRQQGMITRLTVYNISTFHELHKERQQRRFPTLYLDVHQIYNTYPAEWRSLLGNTARTHGPINDEVNIGLNKWIKFEHIQLKTLVRLFTKDYKVCNLHADLVAKHPEMVTEKIKCNPFVNIRKHIKDVKIRNLQYKMLHNIYPTMQHLNKWKIKETDKCNFCNEIETLKHATFDCPKARESIIQLELETCERYGLQRHRVKFDYEDITFGILSTKSILSLGKHQAIAVETIIIELKQRLILQREDKTSLSRIDVTKMFDYRKRIEKYNSIKYCKNIDIEGKWGNMLIA